MGRFRGMFFEITIYSFLVDRDGENESNFFKKRLKGSNVEGKTDFMFDGLAWSNDKVIYFIVLYNKLYYFQPI